MKLCACDEVRLLLKKFYCHHSDFYSITLQDIAFIFL